VTLAVINVTDASTGAQPAATETDLEQYVTLAPEQAANATIRALLRWACVPNSQR